MKWTIALLLMLGLLASLGCQSTGGGKLPHQRLTLKLLAQSQDSRQTYFELDRRGVLSFGGGRDAGLQQARPVLTLDDAQRQAVYDLVQQFNLLDAKGSLFNKPRQVTYHLDLHADGRMRSLRAVDDEVAGLRELHDLLFDWQARERYQIGR